MAQSTLRFSALLDGTPEGTLRIQHATRPRRARPCRTQTRPVPGCLLVQLGESGRPTGMLRMPAGMHLCSGYRRREKKTDWVPAQEAGNDPPALPRQNSPAAERNARAAAGEPLASPQHVSKHKINIPFCSVVSLVNSSSLLFCLGNYRVGDRDRRSTRSERT